MDGKCITPNFKASSLQLDQFKSLKWKKVHFQFSLFKCNILIHTTICSLNKHWLCVLSCKSFESSQFASTFARTMKGRIWKGRVCNMLFGSRYSGKSLQMKTLWSLLYFGRAYTWLLNVAKNVHFSQIKQEMVENKHFGRKNPDWWNAWSKKAKARFLLC